MPFISVKLDAKESKSAPEGRYPLRITQVSEKKTGPKSQKPGVTYYMVMIANESPEAAYAPVFTNIMLPSPDMEDNVNRMRKLEIQRLLSQFNVKGDADGFDTDDLIGATCEGLLTVGEDDKGQERNELKLDRLSGDEDEAIEAAPRRRGRRGAAEADAEIPF